MSGQTRMDISRSRTLNHNFDWVECHDYPRYFQTVVCTHDLHTSIHFDARSMRLANVMYNADEIWHRLHFDINGRNYAISVRHSYRHHRTICHLEADIRGAKKSPYYWLCEFENEPFILFSRKMFLRDVNTFVKTHYCVSRILFLVSYRALSILSHTAHFNPTLPYTRQCVGTYT